jgi:hypothetical protein
MLLYFDTDSVQQQFIIIKLLLRRTLCGYIIPGEVHADWLLIHSLFLDAILWTLTHWKGWPIEVTGQVRKDYCCCCSAGLLLLLGQIVVVVDVRIRVVVSSNNRKEAATHFSAESVLWWGEAESVVRLLPMKVKLVAFKLIVFIHVLTLP